MIIKLSPHMQTVYLLYFARADGLRYNSVILPVYDGIVTPLIAKMFIHLIDRRLTARDPTEVLDDDEESGVGVDV